MNEKLSSNIGQDSGNDQYKDNVSKVKKAKTKYVKGLNEEVVKKDQELQPIKPKKHQDSTGQSNEKGTIITQTSSNTSADAGVTKTTTEENKEGDQSGDDKKDSKTKQRIFKSNYTAPNTFVQNIHQNVGQENLNVQNLVEDEQKSSSKQLSQKKDAVVNKQSDVDKKAKDSIKQGILKSTGVSIAQDLSDFTENTETLIKNTYYSVTDQPEEKG